MNKSFCSLAWTGITTDPDGSLKPCCVSNDHITKDDGTYYNLGIDKLEDIHNSNYYKNLRQSMLNGEMIQGCDVCYNNEKAGRESRRLINNERFKNIKFDNSESDLNIRYFDLRLNNTCNLKCRMCNPINSSLIEEELNHNSILNKFYYNRKIQLENWSETETFDININSQLHNIDTLYMTGGEPTVIKKNYDILERLIDIGKNKDVVLIINTNMTNTNLKFYELLQKFNKVMVQMSIDAHGELDSYIRHPTDFSKVNDNINELLKLKNAQLIATPAIQLLNLNKLTDLFEYLESFNRKFNRNVIDIRPVFVYQPDILNVIYLPTKYKIECFKKVYMWTMTNCKYQSQYFKNNIKALKNKCYEDNFNIDKLKEFLRFNSTLDDIRGLNLKDYNMELHTVLND